MKILDKVTNININSNVIESTIINLALTLGVLMVLIVLHNILLMIIKGQFKKDENE